MTNQENNQQQPHPPVQPYPYYATPQEDEVNLLDYWRIVKTYKRMIYSIVLIVTALIVMLAFWMKPVYKSEVLLAPSQEKKSGGGLAKLASQFGGLASMAGLNIGGSGDSIEVAVATLKSREFTIQFIKDNNLMPVLYSKKWDAENKRWDVDDPKKIPTFNKAYMMFSKKVRSISEDKNTGLITLSIQWKDPVLAAKWANQMVNRLNNLMRQKAIDEAQKSVAYLNKELEKTSVVELQQAIYSLIESQINNIMLANVRNEYSFKIIDPAVPPDNNDFVKPRRALMIIIAFIMSSFFAVFIAFFRFFISQAKEKQSDKN